MQTYDVCFNDRVIGTTEIIKRGLYYHITCKCSLEEGVYRVFAQSENGTVLIGVFYPKDGCYEIDKMVSIKSLGTNIHSFCINPVKTQRCSFYKVHPDQPFAELWQIEKARFAIENGQIGIHIS